MVCVLQVPVVVRFEIFLSNVRNSPGFAHNKHHFIDIMAATVCEGRRHRISCANGKLINIISASYGRKSRSVCPHSRIRTTNCHSFRSLSKVQGACNRKSSCELMALNSVFGDPCYGTYKYLAVQYRCVRAGEIYSFSSREDIQRWDSANSIFPGSFLFLKNRS